MTESSPDDYAADVGGILSALKRRGVDFVLVGGLAGMAHGSAYPTYDVDVAYAREKQNLERMAATLRELGATLRGAPADLPFQLDAETLAHGLNFTVNTSLGPLDILGDPGGARSYDRLRAAAEMCRVEGVEVKVISLDHLIAMKSAAGRAKDKLMVAEYVAIAEERRSRPPKDS